VEKVVYLLWPDGRPGDADVLLGALPGRLVEVGARGVQINVADRGPSPFAVRSAPLPAAVVSVWLDTATHAFRRGVDEEVGQIAARAAAYLVTESEPLANTAHPAPLGQRTPGLAQIALLRRPEQLERGAWLRAWQDDHTSVALRTQSTFRYVQNVVVRPLSPDAPAYDGIVEECFPEEAASDLHVFFDSAGDEARLAEHMATMADSCARFMDVDRVEVFWTSQYVMSDPFADRRGDPSTR